VPGFISDLGLTITVLTSDDVEFAAGISSPVGEDPAGPVQELYNGITRKLSKKPSLLFTFFPLTQQVGGDEFVAAVDAVSGGIPQFGTLSISDDPDFIKAATFHNGESARAAVALVALAGEVNPEFLTISVDDEIVNREKAVVTQANRNILQCVNGMPTRKYMESIGIINEGEITKGDNLPVVVYPEDGTRLIRVSLTLVEDGSLILAGTAPVNSKITFAYIDADMVKASAKTILKQALDTANSEGEHRGMLIYSCVARLWALGAEETAEHEIAEEIVGESVPYHLVYSGGEIMPSILSDGSVVNHQQNYSFIVCIL
jgi:hypothetical protein